MTYADQTSGVQADILNFLRTFERTQQDIRFDDITTSQRTLEQQTADSLERASAMLTQTAVSDTDQATHAALSKALHHLMTCKTIYIHSGAANNFFAAYISSRNEQRKALELLYERRDALPGIEPYFRVSGTSVAVVSSEPSDGAAVGLLHKPKSDIHNEYSLYVPEYYDPGESWPLIVCLHGGYGRGDEYLWTWLRIARSLGYVILSPKSIAQTWSIAQPGRDCQSIVAMLDKVCDQYAVDTSKVYLSGLSDGGTFSYLLGLEHAERFAAIAPIAGVLSPATDFMLRAKQGIELPIHVIHGVHDGVFPVESVRVTNKLLQSLGYQLTYTELPDWGHALTYDINEQIVLPWWQQLEASS